MAAMSENLNSPRLPGLLHTEGRSARLRQRISGKAGSLLMVPGCFDCLTARLVETAGFEAAYVTGAGVSISALGAPDLGLASFFEVLDRVKRICDVLTIPVIADGDTGFGGPLNIIRTVREYERAGVSAIQIEDQEAPKRCGHELGRKLVTVAEMQGRVRAASDARSDENFLIIARTDARTRHGLPEAVDRAGAYREAGADVLFIESPETAEELADVRAAFPDSPLMANMVEGGRTPLLPADMLSELGYAIAIYPNSLTRLIGKAGLALMRELRSTGTTAGSLNTLLSHDELWTLFNRDEWLAVEARYGRNSPTAKTEE